MKTIIMFKIDSIKDEGLSIYRLTLLHIFSIGIGVEISNDNNYKYNRFIIFSGLFGLNITFEILLGSDYDINISLRFF